MGVTIRSRNKYCDMSYGQFGTMRTKLARHILEDMGANGKRAADILEDAYDHTTSEHYAQMLTEFIGHCTGSEKHVYRLIRFVLMQNCVDKLKRKWCRSIVILMDEHPDGWSKDDYLYGYIAHGREACMTLSDFRDMLADGAEKDGIRWT